MKLARLLGRLLGGQPHMTSKTLQDFLDHLLRDFPDHLLLVTVTIGARFSSSVLVDTSSAVDVLCEGSLASTLLVVKLGPPGEIYPMARRTIHTCTTFCAQLLKRGHQGDQLPEPHSLTPGNTALCTIWMHFSDHWIRTLCTATSLGRLN